MEQVEDFIGQAEEDFWKVLAQEKKDIQAKEDKHKNQPTTIPEEGEETKDEEHETAMTVVEQS